MPVCNGFDEKIDTPPSAGNLGPMGSYFVLKDSFEGLRKIRRELRVKESCALSEQCVGQHFQAPSAAPVTTMTNASLRERIRSRGQKRPPQHRTSGHAVSSVDRRIAQVPSLEVTIRCLQWSAKALHVPFYETFEECIASRLQMVQSFHKCAVLTID